MGHEAHLAEQLAARPFRGEGCHAWRPCAWRPYTRLRDALCRLGGKHLAHAHDKHSVDILAPEMQAGCHLGKPSPHPLFSQRE